METLAELTEDQRDALQELMNIAMGQAAERLALLTNTMVTLSDRFRDGGKPVVLLFSRASW